MIENIVNMLVDCTRDFSDSDTEDYKIGYTRVFMKAWNILQFSPNINLKCVVLELETFTAGVVLNSNLSDEYARGAITASKEVISVIERNVNILEC